MLTHRSLRRAAALGFCRRPASSFLPPFTAIASDMDGVLWHGGNDPIAGSIPAMLRLRDSGCPIVFVTNSSTKSREAIAHKLVMLGYSASPDDVITSSYVTAHHVAAQLKESKNKTVFMAGNAVVQAELEKVGLTVHSVPDNAPSNYSEADFAVIEKEASSYAAVIVGLDTAFSYRKLATVSTLVQMGVPFFATNRDVANRLPSGLFSPECGSLLAAIEVSSSRPALDCGKPSAVMVDFVRKTLKTDDPSKILMIGDRLDTDIEFANRSGFLSCLVLSGCTSAAQAAAETDPMKKPTVITKDVSDLVRQIL